MMLFAITTILICFSLIFIHKYRLNCGRKLRLHPTKRNFRQVETKDFTFFDVEYIYGVKLSEVFREMQKSPMIKNKTLDELYNITIENRNPFEYRLIKNLRVLCHKRLREKAKYQQNKNR
jgi:hypothetical protein